MEKEQGFKPGQQLNTKLTISRPVLHMLQSLVLLACLYTLYFARTLFMPVVVAFLLTLLLSPLVTILRRFHVPRIVSAVLLLCAIGGPFIFLVGELAEPAQKWAKRLPEVTILVSEQVETISNALQAPTEGVQPTPGFFSSLFGGEPEPAPDPGVIESEEVNQRIMQTGLELMGSVLVATPVIIAQMMTCVILTIFLLVYGAHLFDAFIALSPRVKDKERSEQLLKTIEVELSKYIVTVSLINAALGACTALALSAVGVEDALLWGVLVGLLNYAPYIGSIIGFLILCLAGLAQYGPELLALMPAGIYLVINMTEAQFVTPAVLGRHMKLNPLILMMWLILWGWLWGAVGVLLAVPLLVCLKLAARQMQVLKPWVTLIETRG